MLNLRVGIATSILLLISLGPFFGASSARSTLLVTTPSPEQHRTANQYYQQGLLQYKANQLDAAIQSWQQALQLSRQSHDQASELEILGALSAGYIGLSNYRQAIDYAQQHQIIAQAANNRAAQAQALGHLGVAYHNLGNYSKALESSQRALVLFQEQNKQQYEGILLRNLGNTYADIGDYKQAISFYEQSLAIARQLKHSNEEANVLSDLGAAYADIGEDDQALTRYQQSLKIAESLQDLPLQARILINLGTTYHILKQSDLGFQHYQRGLALAKQINDRSLQGDALSNLGLIYEDQRDYATAIEIYQQSVKIAQTSQAIQSEAQARNNLAHALLAVKNLQEAETQLRTVLKLLDQGRSGLRDLEQINIFETQAHSYNLLQQVLVAGKHYESALEVSEWGRARPLIQQLGDRLAIKQSSAIHDRPTIQNLKQIAQQQNSTFVEYTLIPEDSFTFRGNQRGKASDIYVWVIQPNGTVTHRTVALPPQLSLSDLVDNSREAIGARGRGSFDIKISKRDPSDRLKQLHELLITPIADLLPTDPNAHVTFIPHGELFLVPFPALQDAKGQYLIERHTLLTAPAIQVLDLTRQKHQQVTQAGLKDVVIVGNPTMPQLTKPGEAPKQLEALPGAEREANRIADRFKTKAWLGAQATKAAIVPKLSQARIIHLATHGLLDDLKGLGTPGAIALAPSGTGEANDGLLTANEILDLKLNAELVVLSACDTGRGKITSDSVIGLSRSLILAGTSSVMVSLWSVPDAPTAELMAEFYQNWQDRNLDKAQALRQAMLTIMKRPGTTPKDWAAFTLIGESQ